MEREELFILRGMNAKKFTEYQNRKATPEEIAYFKKSEEYYLKHSKPPQVKNGENFPITGYYKYAGHVIPTTEDCFITEISARMLFKKGHTAPSTGSCTHDIVWEFIYKF